MDILLPSDLNDVKPSIDLSWFPLEGHIPAFKYCLLKSFIPFSGVVSVSIGGLSNKLLILDSGVINFWISYCFLFYICLKLRSFPVKPLRLYKKGGDIFPVIPISDVVWLP